MFIQHIFRFTKNINIYEWKKLVIKFKYIIVCKYSVYNNYNYYCVANWRQISKDFTQITIDNYNKMFIFNFINILQVLCLMFFFKNILILMIRPYLCCLYEKCCHILSNQNKLLVPYSVENINNNRGNVKFTNVYRNVRDV
jgi:hypothetical protein